MKISKRLLIGTFLITMNSISGTSGTLYAVQTQNNVIFSIDSATGYSTSFYLWSDDYNVPAYSGGIVISEDRKHGYIGDLDTGNIYKFDLITGQSNLILTAPEPSDPPYIKSFAISFKPGTDEKIAYVTSQDLPDSYNSGTIYKVDFFTSSYQPLFPSISDYFYDIAFANEKTAYTTGYSKGKIYRIDASLETASIAIDLSGEQNHDIAYIGLKDVAANGDVTGYVACLSGDIYSFDTSDGSYKKITSPSLENIIPSNPKPTIGGLVVNGDTGYIVGSNNQFIAFDLNTGEVLQNFTLPLTGLGLDYLAFLPNLPPPPSPPLVINTTGLTGNNLAFANYLNANAPQSVIDIFATLASGLSNALESAAPTRNAFVTFSSQNGFLASSQVINDHLRYKKVADLSSRRGELAAFVADCSSEYAKSFDDCCDSSSRFTIWTAPFGEYAKEKKQNQTPAFHLGVGGIITAIDYMTTNGHVFGLGGGYVHTHLEEDHNCGDANINQGYLLAYATLNTPVYIDLSAWGGYYQGKNHRHIRFDSIDVTAKATIDGWQFATHGEVGYHPFYYENRSFGIEPYVAADWVGNWEKGFSERGAGALNMGQHGRFTSLLRAESGVRFSQMIEFNSGGKLFFQEVGSYVYQKAFDNQSIRAFLVGSPGSFSVSTLTGAKNIGLFSLSMLYQPRHPKLPYVKVRYQEEFGSKFHSRLGSVEIGKTF